MESREPRRKPILEATIRVVGSKGYPATSVADVIAEAGASRSTFYKYFQDKRGAFLEAYDLAIGRILAVALEHPHRGEHWTEAARARLAAVIDLLAADPGLARTAVVEFSAAGGEARRRHWAALERLARGLDELRPAHPRLPPSTALMTVGGIVALIADELRAGRTRELPGFLPELEFALLVPFIGPQAARGAQRDAA